MHAQEPAAPDDRIAAMAIVATTTVSIFTTLAGIAHARTEEWINAVGCSVTGAASIVIAVWISHVIDATEETFTPFRVMMPGLITGFLMLWGRPERPLPLQGVAPVSARSR